MNSQSQKKSSVSLVVAGYKNIRDEKVEMILM